MTAANINLLQATADVSLESAVACGCTGQSGDFYTCKVKDFLKLSPTEMNKPDHAVVSLYLARGEPDCGLNSNMTWLNNYSFCG